MKQTKRDREDERKGMEREHKERKEEHRVANGMKLPEHHGMHEAEHRRK